MESFGIARRLLRVAIAVVTAICLIGQTLAAAATVHLPSGSRIYVETREALVAKDGKVQQGQSVNAAVWRDVVIDGQVVIPAGTSVAVKVDSVSGRNIAGVKGTMSLAALETQSVDGQMIPLTGGYNKAGESRMATSIVLGVLFILPIFIPGGAAEIPTGTVFDATINRSADIAVKASETPHVIDLTGLAKTISAELLYDKLEAQEKPEYFDFLITVPADMPRRFVVDRVNSQPIEPLNLKAVSETEIDGDVRVQAQIKIKPLVKQFRKGINTIEIACGACEERQATEIVVNLQM